MSAYWHKSGSALWRSENGRRVYVLKTTNGCYRIQIDHTQVAVAKGQNNAKEIAIKLAQAEVA